MIRSEWKGISVCILRQLQCLPAKSSYYSTCRPIHMSANVCVFQHLPSATVCCPTPAVSYSVCHPNTCRQLQCIVTTPAVSYSVSSQHLPSATVYRHNTCRQLHRHNTCRQLQCIIPTPAVSYSVSSQHLPSATVYRHNTCRQLQCIVTTPAVSGNSDWFLYRLSDTQLR